MAHMTEYDMEEIGRKGGRVVLYIREVLDCMELSYGTESAEWPLGKSQGKDQQGRYCGRSMLQTTQTQRRSRLNIFYKHIKEVSQSLAFILSGVFNFPDTCWKYSIAEKKKTKRFLNCSEKNRTASVTQQIKKKKVYNIWKKEQATQGDYKDAVKLCREESKWPKTS